MINWSFHIARVAVYMKRYNPSENSSLFVSQFSPHYLSLDRNPRVSTIVNMQSKAILLLLVAGLCAAAPIPQYPAAGGGGSAGFGAGFGMNAGVGGGAGSGGSGGVGGNAGFGFGFNAGASAGAGAGAGAVSTRTPSLVVYVFSNIQ
jgi:hypothetical protein